MLQKQMKLSNTMLGYEEEKEAVKVDILFIYKNQKHFGNMKVDNKFAAKITKFIAIFTDAGKP